MSLPDAKIISWDVLVKLGQVTTITIKGEPAQAKVGKRTVTEKDGQPVTIQEIKTKTAVAYGDEFEINGNCFSVFYIKPGTVNFVKGTLI